MNEASLVQAALILPIGAAVYAMLVGDGPTGRATPVLLVAAAAVAAAAGGVFAALGEPVVWKGFELDAWRSLLAAGALAGAASAMTRGRVGFRAAVAVGAGSAAAAIVSPDALHLGVTLALSSAAFAVAGVALSDVSARGRARLLAMLLASDALALGALAWAARTTLSLEDIPDGPAALVLAAAIVRLGLAAPPVRDAMRTGTAGLLLGPVRAHGALLAVLAAGGSSTRGFWLLAAGGVAASFAAIRLIRDPDPAALLVVPAAVAAAGIGIGGPVAIAGAALTLAIAFAASILLAGDEPLIAAPVAAFAPAGGALLGFALAGGALWRLAAARAEFLPAAIALAIATGLAAVTAWPATHRLRASARLRTEPAFGGSLVAIPAIVAAGIAAFAPAVAAERAGTAVALAAGAAPALIPAPESFAEGLGISIAVLALIGLLTGGAAPRIDDVATEPDRVALDAIEPVPRRWLVAAAAGAAVTAVALARLIQIAGGRGWL